MRLIAITGLVVAILATTVDAECGYSACPKTDPKKLNIHLIPHSHDDVGWMTTADSYYTDSVRDIINNVVKSLRANQNRRFTQVETYFFNHWWSEQGEDMRTAFKGLVNSGQLVFSNGGWTVNDEGAAYYDNIIDQMTLGLKMLDSNFGKCGRPTVSWQIDPFGASKEMASLYAQMGFDGHFHNRGIRPKGEFVWRASADLSADIFTSNLHSHYSAPNGFNFEGNGNNINDSNSVAKGNDFVKVAKEWNSNYGNTSHVLMTMGDDFQYKNAENWFSNIDKLIHEIAVNHTDVNIFYSTPNCYIYSMSQLNRTWDQRDSDYMNYWVGYYTSRPALKRDDRISNNFLQASKQLDVLASLNTASTNAFLDETRNEVAIMTHHDAITGTSPQSTADDYTRRLYSGWDASRTILQKAYRALLPKTADRNSPDQVFCDTLNISYCGLTQTSTHIAVNIYNPIARPVSQWIRVPVGAGTFEVFDQNQERVTNAEIVPIAKSVIAIPGRKSGALSELVFKANLPALGFATYLVRRSNNFRKKRSSIARNKRAVFEMKGKSFAIGVDDQTGELKSITLNGKTHALTQSLKYYKSCGGVKDVEDSGSYHFCPNGTAVSFSTPKLVSKFNSGPIYEVSNQWSDWAKQTIRTYEDEEYVEFDWIVGPIPIGDGIGKEIITRFESDLKNDRVFYTDANGRQMVHRVRDPNAKGCTNNNITANWYPIYSRIFIRDESQNLQMTVLSDRTQGGSSIVDSTVELMVHRRLLHTGAGGGFTINETGVDGTGLVVRGKHYLFFKPISESAKLHRQLAQRLFMEPIVSFSAYSESETDFRAKWSNTFSGVSRALPENVHLLTLENWKKNQLLLRLEHYFESADNGELSKPVDVSLDGLFKAFKITSIAETNLVANQLLADITRLQWNNRRPLTNNVSPVTNLTVRLTPQQIRTFILTVDETLQTEEKCALSWRNVTDNQMPTDAIVGGYDTDKSPLYVCRHTDNGDQMPGKASHGLGCHVTYGGKELEIKAGYEVLVGKNGEWVPRHGVDPLPPNAFLAGKSASGYPLYVGRCTIEGSNYSTQVIGKIHYWFYYPYGNAEHTGCDNHQVLVCNS